MKRKLNKNIFKEFLLDNQASIDRNKLLKYSSIILIATASALFQNVDGGMTTTVTDRGSDHANGTGSGQHCSDHKSASGHCSGDSPHGNAHGSAADHLSGHDNNDWHNNKVHANATNHGNDMDAWRSGSTFYGKHAHEYADVEWTCSTK